MPFCTTAYGAISSRRGVGSAPMPLSVPACDTYPFTLRLRRGQEIRWPVRATSRLISSPNVCSVPGAKRIWLNGMRNSATQPAESILVATSHTASQEPSSSWSLKT